MLPEDFADMVERLGHARPAPPTRLEAINALDGAAVTALAESYRRAVGHWVPEERLLAGEFLAIAAETLSRFLIESRPHPEEPGSCEPP
jgi:hypothetical protein